MKQYLLEVENLSVAFPSRNRRVMAVRGISFKLKQEATLAIVGESGSGKSTALLALMGLLSHLHAEVDAANVQFQDKPFSLDYSTHTKEIRGQHMAMIFQDPMNALNPTMSIGKQIMEPLIIHRKLSRSQAYKTACDLLKQVHISEPEYRMKQFPHTCSGGILQRIMIAIAISCDPQLLIADEPSTALDVTTQAQILRLLAELKSTHCMSMILVTHDLSIVKRVSDHVAVMYAGQIVELTTTQKLFESTKHPYTQGLKESQPSQQKKGTPLPYIDGNPPDLAFPPKGCAYFERCPHAMKVCHTQDPAIFKIDNDHIVKCWLYHPEYTKKSL